jgi:hypothetical protein
MDITTQMNYLIFGFKETGDATYLFKMNRILNDFLNDLVEDYLQDDGCEVPEANNSVLNRFNWIQSSTSGNDLTYRIGCQD